MLVQKQKLDYISSLDIKMIQGPSSFMFFILPSLIIFLKSSKSSKIMIICRYYNLQIQPETDFISMCIDYSSCDHDGHGSVGIKLLLLFCFKTQLL